MICADCPRSSGSFRWCLVCVVLAGRARTEQWNSRARRAVLGVTVYRWHRADLWLAASGGQADELHRRRSLYAPEDFTSTEPEPQAVGT